MTTNRLHICFLVALLVTFSANEAFSQSDFSTDAAATIKGLDKLKYGTIPVLDTMSKKSGDKALVISATEAQLIPMLTPDINKHPEIGLVKLEGSPESIELVELREANSRTFRNPDGSYTKQQTKGVFHYKDAQGYWRSIGRTPTILENGSVGIDATDLPITINTLTGTTNMQLDTYGGDLVFGKDAQITYLDAQGNVVEALNAGSAAAYELDGKVLKLKGLWPNIDRNQTIDYYQVETDYILQNRPALQLPGGSMVFTENLTLPKGWKIEKGNGKDTLGGFMGVLHILDTKGTVKGTFQRLVFFDSNADSKKEGHSANGVYTFKQTGDKVALGIVVPIDWLSSADRQYPVTIDPTATNTYASFGLLYWGGYTTSCQQTMNVNVPAGTITGTATSYSVRAYLDAWRSEQRSRVGVAGTFTATQSGVGNSSGTYNYSLTGQTIVNGAHGGGNILFVWQGYRTYLSYYDYFYCDYWTQELLSNTWVVTVTYTTTPCSGNPDPGTLAISATTGCAGTTNFTLTSSGYTTTGSGLEYNFQQSDAGSGVWTDLTGWLALGGSNPTYTTNTTVAKDYRIQYRCNGGAAQNSNTVTHTPVTCIYLNVNQQVQTTCAAKIYDSGGPSGNYLNNEARVVMIYPTSSDQILTVSGTYNTELDYDFISATDGASSDIETYLTPHYYSGSGSFSISSPGPGIPLTIKFQSDGGVVGSGFDLDVSCSCAVPTAGTTVAQNIISCGETSDIFFTGADGQDYYSFANTSFVGNTLPSGATISGNATVTGEYVRLTSTATNQGGSLVFNNTNGLNGNEFLTYFKIYAGGGSGADGMSFSFGPNISNSPVGSESGHGNGVKVIFDSYNNGASGLSCNGTNYSSVYLMYDNTVLGCYTNFNYTAWRNAWRLMVIQINENGQITVSNPEAGGPVYFNNVQLPAAYLSANKSTWKVAFSARTGGATDNHYVDDVNIYFANQFEYSINNGSTWSPSTTFSGLGAGTYNPRIRNKNVTCGNRSLSAITIQAPPALPSIPSVSNSGPICSGGSVNLSATGLAPSGKVANVVGTQIIGGNLVTAAANSFTMEFWAKPTATRASTTQSNTGTSGTSNQRYAIYPSHGSADAGAGVSVGTDGISVFEHGSGYLPSVLVYDFQSPKTDWMHIAVVYNNRTPSLYINGVFVKTGVTSARSNVYASSGTGGSYGYYNGQVDNIRIWNDVRTVAEIRANMHIEAPADNAGLVARYDFNASNVNATFGSPNNSNGGATFSNASYYTYSWSGTNAPGATTNETVSVNNPSGSYSVSYNTSDNCGATTGGSTAVTVNPIPSASISGTNTICAGGSSTFTASGGGTYLWSTGATTAAISVSTAATYTVTVANNGCTATASRTLTVNAAPTVSITPASPSVCSGVSVTLTASGGASYAWSTSENTAETTVSPSTTTSYTVTVTGANTCTATTSKSVTVTQLTIGGQTFQSGDYVFSGTVSGGWANAGNWYEYNGSSFDPASSVPSASTNIFIYPIATHTCIVRSSVNLSGTNNAKDVYIKPGATINGTANTRTINVYGNWTNEGTFTMGNSTVAFRGSTNTTASAGGSTFYNVTVNKSNNGAVVQFLEDFTCTQDFLLTRGTVEVPQDVTGEALSTTVDVNGNLILRQKATGTKGGEFRTNP